MTTVSQLPGITQTSKKPVFGLQRGQITTSKPPHLMSKPDEVLFSGLPNLPGSGPGEVNCPNIELMSGLMKSRARKKANAWLATMTQALKDEDVATFNEAKQQLYYKLEEEGALGIPEPYTPSSHPSNPDNKMVLVLSDHEMLSGKNLSKIDLSGVALRTSSGLQDQKQATFHDGHTEFINDYVTLNKTNLQGANLFHADLRGAELFTTNFYRANLQRADLSDTTLDFTVFKNAHFDRTNFYGAQVIGDLVVGNYRDMVYGCIELPSEEKITYYARTNDLVKGGNNYKMFHYWDEVNAQRGSSSYEDSSSFRW